MTEACTVPQWSPGKKFIGISLTPGGGQQLPVLIIPWIC